MDDCDVQVALEEAPPRPHGARVRYVWPAPVPTQRQRIQRATLAQTGADPPPLASLQEEIRALRGNYESLARRLHQCEDWIDTVSSPLYKRLWFVLHGWRWKRLGRWTGPDTTAWPWRPGD